MPVELHNLHWSTSEGLVDLVETDLEEIGSHGKDGRKDEGRLRAAMQAWAEQGFEGRFGLDFRPIEGKPYERKMWEARYLRSARSDGVHGYRIFYTRTRHPKTGDEVAILLGVFAKEGDATPPAVLKRMWGYCESVRKLIDDGKYFQED